jgi:hypothetical protein
MVREVLQAWVERLRADALHSEIARYAAERAGTSVDIDPELEAAGIESLVAKPAKVKPFHPRAKRK